MMVRILLTCMSFVIATPLSFGAIEVAFVTGPDPWGTSPTNALRQNLNTAFGAGGWQEFHFMNAISGGLLTNPDYKFIYIDGGDGAEGNFISFINTNRTALENWVAGGGSLLLNAARWTNGTFNLGFGATLNLSGATLSPTGTAVDPNHPVFDAGTGLSWSGNYFAHDVLTGAGLSPIISGVSSQIVLAEKSWGDGHVMLGGMTHPSFHSPNVAANNLRVNILEYGLAMAGSGSNGAVPEATSLIMWSLLICAGMTLGCRHRARLEA